MWHVANFYIVASTCILMTTHNVYILLNLGTGYKSIYILYMHQQQFCLKCEMLDNYIYNYMIISLSLACKQHGYVDGVFGF